MPSSDAGRSANNSDDVRQRAAALLCAELGAESSTADAHRAAVAEWVESRRIRPPRDVGDAVSFKVRGEQLDGEITGIDAAQASYTIYVPSL